MSERLRTGRYSLSPAKGWSWIGDHSPILDLIWSRLGTGDEGQGWRYYNFTAETSIFCSDTEKPSRLSIAFLPGSEGTRIRSAWVEAGVDDEFLNELSAVVSELITQFGCSLLEAKTMKPCVNLLVIRSEDIDRAVIFYQTIGFTFDKHSHGSGAEHYACESNGFVFEIYPLSPKQQPTIWTRVGFSVGDVDSLVGRLAEVGATIVSSPKASEWGRRAVVKDLDGHTVELVETNKVE